MDPLSTATGLEQVVAQYAHLGSFLAALLANFFATFGDKGQLAILVLATRYDSKRVFIGAMGAFAAWSAVEVVLGKYVVASLTGGVIRYVTGTTFVIFGLWTAWQVRRQVSGGGWTETDGGAVASPAGPLVDRLTSFAAGYGGTATAFVFVGLAEFGDKTQLLTVNLAATFPASPGAVYVGVVLALALRTGVDAFVGGRAERYLPTLHVQVAGAVVFVAFGLFELGVLGGLSLVVAIVAAIAFTVGAGVERRLNTGP